MWWTQGRFIVNPPEGLTLTETIEQRKDKMVPIERTVL